jgi:hypothetical protein
MAGIVRRSPPAAGQLCIRSREVLLSIVVVLVALRIPEGTGRRSCYSAEHAVGAQATRATSGKGRATRA